jgi:hypothetical protein
MEIREIDSCAMKSKSSDEFAAIVSDGINEINVVKLST